MTAFGSSSQGGACQRWKSRCNVGSSGLLLAAALGLAAVLRAGSHGSAKRNEYPWPLVEVSKLHVGIVGSVAGFAFTGVVLVVTLA